MSIAPFFSRRARERRSALRGARSDASESFVTLVLGYPLQTIDDGQFRQPALLEASSTGIDVRSLDRTTAVWSARWAEIPRSRLAAKIEAKRT